MEIKQCNRFTFALRLLVTQPPIKYNAEQALRLCRRSRQRLWCPTTEKALDCRMAQEFQIYVCNMYPCVTQKLLGSMPFHNPIIMEGGLIAKRTTATFFLADWVIRTTTWTLPAIPTWKQPMRIGYWSWFAVGSQYKRVLLLLILRLLHQYIYA